MSKTIKLIYDKYENDIGVLYDENNEIEIDKIKILDNLPTKINDINININRLLNIYSWGIKKDKKSVKCDIIFDASLFSAKINTDVKMLTGLNEIVQQGIINHPKFDIILEMMLTEIETNDYQKIGIICNYGKHRSVGFAELLKKIYYPKSVINHKGI